MRARRWVQWVGVLAAACSSGTGQVPGPTPPTVRLTPSTTSAVDTHLGVSVTVEGCPSGIASLELFDHGQSLQQVAAPGPLTTFDLPETAFDYKADGVQATLDLHARATCLASGPDAGVGLSGDSDGVGVVFMPAVQVAPGSFQGTAFNIDPDGKHVYQCLSGVVARLGLDGAVAATTSPGALANCSAAGYAQFGGAGEAYWVEPGAYFARLDVATMAVKHTHSYALTSLYLPPSSGGAAVALGTSSTQNNMLWVDRGTGQESGPIALHGVPNGAPALTLHGLAVPEQLKNFDGTFQLQVEFFDVSTGGQAQLAVLAQLNATWLGVIDVPPMALSADGNQAYFVGGTAGNEVYACGSGLPCVESSQGGGLIYKVTLPGGPYVTAVPLGASLFVASSRAAQFLDLAHGQPQGDVFAPTGGLSFQTVFNGPGGGFYVLSGDTQGHTLELVEMASAAAEGARYHVDTGGFGVDFDGQARPWVLTGGKLVQLFTPQQYLTSRR